MGVPVKYYTFVDSQADAGKITAARLNGDFDPLYACLDPATGGLEDTNVKTGAKIVCTDRAHTVTGVWTFTTAPVFPDASIPGAKLAADVNADTVDSLHASAFAVAAKGVTNGDSHDHSGGDGGAIPEAGLTLADNTTGDVSTAKHGFAPKAPNDTTKFLRGDASWAATAGYVLGLTSLTFNPSDGLTYYFGNIGRAPATTAAMGRLYIPKAGTIKVAYIAAYCTVVASSEDVSVYIRLNNTTDTLVQTAYLDSPVNTFIKSDLSIAVVAGDYIEIKVVCPTFATNPTGVHFYGNIYVE